MYIIYDDFYLRHDSGPSHPENAQRLKTAVNSVSTANNKLKGKLIFEKPYPAKEEQIQLVHDNSYVERVKKLSKRGGYFYLDLDTVVSEYTYDCALLAGGGCFRGLDLIYDKNKKSNKFFALIRPPGHHAFKSYGSGFCIFNNIALASRYAQNNYGIKRIAIFDFDAHHGNGTQDIFYRDGSIFYISFHQYPHYPGTGFYDEVGSGNGKKFNLNFPFPPGTKEDAYLISIVDIIFPLMKNYKPQLILVSAGYDSHTEDFLSSLNLEDDSYYKIMNLISYISHIYCDGRLGIVLEGGYSHHATARSIVKTILGCSDEKFFQDIKNEQSLKEKIKINSNIYSNTSQKVLKILNEIKKIFEI